MSKRGERAATPITNQSTAAITSNTRGTSQPLTRSSGASSKQSSSNERSNEVPPSSGSSSSRGSSSATITTTATTTTIISSTTPSTTTNNSAVNLIPDETSNSSTFDELTRDNADATQTPISNSNNTNNNANNANSTTTNQSHASKTDSFFQRIKKRPISSLMNSETDAELTWYGRKFH